MKRLLLLRHAKSSWADPEQRDFDRPLNDRGLKAAKAMGAYMKSAFAQPETVVCSPAVRTRATLDLLREGSGWPLSARFDERIYMAVTDTLLEIVHSLPENAETALVIGHNPGLEDLALLLTGTAQEADRAALAEKYPTGALCVLEAQGDWSAFKRKACHLERFIWPKALAADLEGD
jgi:phosphohistidine phosphatase